MKSTSYCAVRESILSKKVSTDLRFYFPAIIIKVPPNFLVLMVFEQKTCVCVTLRKFRNTGGNKKASFFYLVDNMLKHSRV